MNTQQSRQWSENYLKYIDSFCDYDPHIMWCYFCVRGDEILPTVSCLFNLKSRKIMVFTYWKRIKTDKKSYIWLLLELITQLYFPKTEIEIILFIIQRSQSVFGWVFLVCFLFCFDFFPQQYWLSLTLWICLLIFSCLLLIYAPIISLGCRMNWIKL